MNRMQQQVAASFSDGEQVLAAVSGGMDSMVLLDCLLRCTPSLLLRVAHFNHGLRGKESDADEELVRSFCKRHNIPFFSVRKDIAALAARDRISVELCGRRERYAFFESLGGTIATAHTLSDRVETLLYHIARGTSLAGLCSIPEKRGNIVRPLLKFTRAEIEAYCKRYHVPFREDSSNLSDCYARNRIRHYAVPVLRAVNPEFERHAGRLMNYLQEDEQFLQQAAHDAWQKASDQKGLSAQAVANMPLSIQRRVLALWVSERQIAVSDDIITRLIRLCRAGEGRQSLPGEKLAVVRQGWLTLDRMVDERDFCVKLPESFSFSYRNLQFIRCAKEECDQFLNNPKDCFISAIDYDKIKGSVFLQNRQPGDALKLKNRPRKSVKKLIQETGLSLEQRSQIIVLRDDLGVLWVSGFGADERAQIEKTTCNYLWILWKTKD